MSRIISFVLLCTLIGIQLSVKTIVLINWKINQVRITEKYCVNKDKPMLQCNGRCYLAKKLRAAELEKQRSEKEERTKNDAPLKKMTSGDHFMAFYAADSKSLHNVRASSKKLFRAFSMHLASPFENSIFHPPC